MKLKTSIQLFMIIVVCLGGVVANAQSLRPNTPYWSLVSELESHGINAFARFEWSDQNLEALSKASSTLTNLKNQIVNHRLILKASGDNPGFRGFTTLLKTNEIYIQIYQASYLKNIDVAITLGHELIHAGHIDNYIFNYWKSLVSHDQKKYAECTSEIGAYTWSAIYAENKSMSDWYHLQIAEYQTCAKTLLN